MNKFLFIFLFLAGCSNSNSYDSNLSTKKSSSISPGDMCNNNCIWSKYAVDLNVQTGTVNCAGGKCACVEEGNIHNLCIASTSEQLESLPNRNNHINTNMPLDIPYLNQYDNQLSPSATCQNTSIAMVLRFYGWQGTPDEITSEWGRHYAQSPTGLSRLISRYGESLNIRSIPHTNGTINQLKSILDKGFPVVIHGYFTRSGHVVVVTGYNENGYYVNDPAGTWNQSFMGGYHGSYDGKNVFYNKSSFEAAISTSDGYSYLPIWLHEIKEI